jgi:CheY-like chemotaxis protein
MIPAPTREPELKDAVNLSRSILLVIDDDRAVREALREVLQEEGYLVITATNGKEALDVLDTVARPDMAIVDLMMPVMDGWGFVAELRQRPQFSSIPVVVITAGGDRVLANAPVAAGYLKKPVKVDDLLAVIRRRLTTPPPS